MDTDSCSSDLKLVLETSTDDISVSDAPTSKPSESSATESKTDKDSETILDKGVTEKPKPVTSGLTVRSASGNQQSRRIQVTTLSLNK